MRHCLLAVAVVVGVSIAMPAQQPAWPPSPNHSTLKLWPHGAPGAQPNPAAEMNTHHCQRPRGGGPAGARYRKNAAFHSCAGGG
jgi:hypothetical protein